MLSGVGDLGRGDEAREAPADHNYVCIIGHCIVPRNVTDRSLRLEARSTENGSGTVAAVHRRRVNLFQFGTYRHVGCSAPATLDLNLILVLSSVWTKTRSRNTLLVHHGR